MKKLNKTKASRNLARQGRSQNLKPSYLENKHLSGEHQENLARKCPVKLRAYNFGIYLHEPFLA
eukprot:11500714-Karenia_brevis.AAC.1